MNVEVGGVHYPGKDFEVSNGKVHLSCALKADSRDPLWRSWQVTLESQVAEISATLAAIRSRSDRGNRCLMLGLIDKPQTELQGALWGYYANRLGIELGKSLESLSGYCGVKAQAVRNRDGAKFLLQLSRAQSIATQIGEFLSKKAKPETL